LSIHPTSIVSDTATISEDAEIGPYCLIQGRVEIGRGTLIESHARIGHTSGHVSIGEDNYIQSGAVLGGPPQDVSYADADTGLTIGNHNRIGEYVSINLGTDKGGGVTRLGDHNFIMAYVHLGHDCQLDNHVVITNTTQLAGHVVVEQHALLSGLVGSTQFVRFGAYSFVAAGSFANKDIPPYTIAKGHWATPRATNRVALKRAGFEASERRNIDRAVRILLDRSLKIEEVVAEIERHCVASPQIEHFTGFLTSSQQGVARG